MDKAYYLKLKGKYEQLLGCAYALEEKQKRRESGNRDGNDSSKHSSDDSSDSDVGPRQSKFTLREFRRLVSLQDPEEVVVDEAAEDLSGVEIGASIN